MWIIIASSAIGVTLISILFIVCYRVGWFDRQDHHSKSSFYSMYHSNLYRSTKLEWTINDTFLEFDPLIPVYTAEKHKPNQAAPHKLTFDTQLSFN